MDAWVVNALWMAALGAAGVMVSRSAITRLIRSRAAQLPGVSPVSYAQADAMARRALRAAAAARRAMASPDQPTTRSSQLPTRTAADGRGEIEYRVIVTYESPDSGDKINASVTVRSREPITASEAIDIAMNTAGRSEIATPPSLPKLSRERREAFPDYIPVSGQVVTISRR